MQTNKKIVKRRPKKVSVNKKAKLPAYDKDFYKWTKTQANLLKKEEFQKLDLENLIEEIESLGRSEKRTLKSYLKILLLHLLKVKFQPNNHTNSWKLSIKNSRFEAKGVLKENPSLKPKLPEILKEAYFSARLEAAKETGLDEKTFPQDCPWKIEDIFNENA